MPPNYFQRKSDKFSKESPDEVKKLKKEVKSDKKAKKLNLDKPQEEKPTSNGGIRRRRSRSSRRGSASSTSTNPPPVEGEEIGEIIVKESPEQSGEDSLTVNKQEVSYEEWVASEETVQESGHFSGEEGGQDIACDISKGDSDNLAGPKVENSTTEHSVVANHFPDSKPSTVVSNESDQSAKDSESGKVSPKDNLFDKLYGSEYNPDMSAEDLFDDMMKNSAPSTPVKRPESANGLEETSSENKSEPKSEERSELSVEIPDNQSPAEESEEVYV